jgi:hypothetical protein
LFGCSEVVIPVNFIVVLDTFSFVKIESIRALLTASFGATLLAVDFTYVEFPKRSFGAGLLQGCGVEDYYEKR